MQSANRFWYQYFKTKDLLVGVSSWANLKVKLWLVPLYLILLGYIFIGNFINGSIDTAFLSVIFCLYPIDRLQKPRKVSFPQVNGSAAAGSLKLQTCPLLYSFIGFNGNFYIGYLMYIFFIVNTTGRKPPAAAYIFLLKLYDFNRYINA